MSASNAHTSVGTGRRYSPGASYGWRARIGMLFPQFVADTLVHEFYLMAPAGVELVITSLDIAGMDEYEKAVDNLERSLRRLLLHEPDAIVQAGVPPIVARGWGFEDELRSLVRNLTPRPFFSDMGASIAAMKAVGISRLVMLSSSFDDDLAAVIGRYLKGAGLELLAAKNMNAPFPQTTVLPLEAVYRAGGRLFQEHAGRADGLWITQASMPSVGVIEDLERDLQAPVVTSAQAMMWAALGGAGVSEPLPGFGRLFESQVPAGSTDRVT